MTLTRSHNPPALAAPNGFSHVVVTTGQTQVQVSGQVAYDASGNVVGVDDLARPELLLEVEAVAIMTEAQP